MRQDFNVSFRFLDSPLVLKAVLKDSTFRDAVERAIREHMVDVHDCCEIKIEKVYNVVEEIDKLLERTK